MQNEQTAHTIVPLQTAFQSGSVSYLSNSPTERQSLPPLPPRLKTMRTTCLAIALLSIHASSAQGPMRNWRFGWVTALDMEAGPPAFQDGSAMLAIESCISVSSDSGDLLFYSEGVQVFNANDALMPNGTGLLSNSYDWQQGVATCPFPGDPDKHLLFHNGMDQILRVSTVDMSLEGGLGDVTLKNIVVTPNIAEAMTIAPHSNGVDYWLVVRDFPADLFKVFPITNAGVGPVVSSVACGMDTFDFTGMARFNHAHNRLAVTMRGVFGNMGKVGLFPFNPSTGVLGAGTLTSTFAPWGLEFSCSDRLLYLSHNDFAPIEQFNMLAGSPAQILASAIDVSEPIVTLDLAYAPDNRIYFTWNDEFDNGARALGSIGQPDQPGQGCDVTYSAVVWTDVNSRSTTGLPNFIQRSQSDIGNCTPLATTIDELSEPALVSITSPVQDGALLRLPAGSRTSLSILDANGRIVRQEQARGEEHWLNTASLTAGIYLLRAETLADGMSEAVRFVKE
jgi:hypothetical protein